MEDQQSQGFKQRRKGRYTMGRLGRIQTSFKWNWSEVDSPGSAMNSIYALTEKAKKNKISMESYISLFKEYVQKAGIVTDET